MDVDGPTVYGVFGHACDILTGDEREDISIPPGVTYVTISRCGFLSIDLIKLMYAFEDPSIQGALEDPLNNLDKLNAYFSTREHMSTDIHVRTYGDTYVDSENTLLADLGNIILKSGIYTLNTFKPADPLADIEIEPGRYARQGPFSVNDINAVYEGSLLVPEIPVKPYKTAEEVITAMNNRRVRISDIFSAGGPGIYYNFACRTVCADGLHIRAAHRRMKSKDKAPIQAEYSVSKQKQDIMAFLDKSHTSSLFTYTKEWMDRREPHRLAYIRKQHTKRHRGGKRSKMTRRKDSTYR